jgi:hypothetical protein
VNLPFSHQTRAALGSPLGALGSPGEIHSPALHGIFTRDRLRKGDGKPLQEAEDAGLITMAQARDLHRRADRTSVQHDFSYRELMQVYEKADESEREQLKTILHTKRDNLFKVGRGAEAAAAEANQ